MVRVAIAMIVAWVAVPAARAQTVKPSAIWCGNVKKPQRGGPCKPSAPHPDARVFEGAELRGRVRSAPVWNDINADGSGEHEVTFDFEPEIGWASTSPNAINTLDKVVRYSTPIVPNDCLAGRAVGTCYGKDSWRAEGSGVALHVEVNAWGPGRVCPGWKLGRPTCPEYANRPPGWDYRIARFATVGGKCPLTPGAQQPLSPPSYLPFFINPWGGGGCVIVTRPDGTHVASVHPDGSEQPPPTAVIYDSYVRIVGTLWEDGEHGNLGGCFTQDSTRGRGHMEIHPVDLLEPLAAPPARSARIHVEEVCQGTAGGPEVRNKPWLGATRDVRPLRYVDPNGKVLPTAPAACAAEVVQEVVDGSFTNAASVAPVHFRENGYAVRFTAQVSAKAGIGGYRGLFRAGYVVDWNCQGPPARGFYRQKDEKKVYLLYDAGAYCHVASDEQMDAFGGFGKVAVVDRLRFGSATLTGHCGWPNGFFKYRAPTKKEVYRLYGQPSSSPFALGDKICRVANDAQMNAFGGYGQMRTVDAQPPLTTGRTSTGTCRDP
jgi:hypothetical protein